MGLIFQDKNIENGLNNWEFDRVAELRKIQAEMDFSYTPHYCKYLADIGKLDEVGQYFKEKNLLDRYLSEDSFRVCVYLYNLDNRMMNSDGFFSILYKNTKLKKGRDVLIALNSNWDAYIKHDISSEENMLLNYALNLLFDKFLVDVSLLIKVVNHLSVAKNLNPQRRKYLLNKVVRYALENEALASDFFKLRDQFYNQIQKVLSLIHQFSSVELGSSSLQKIFYDAIRKYNDLSLVQSVDKHSPRVALCISGICKSDLTGLKSIFENIVKPLNADVFMHTWDMQQDWVGDARPYKFWFRTFGASEVPKNLEDLEFLKLNYPNIYSSLLSSHFSTLDKETLFEEFSFQGFEYENQDEFLRKNNIGESYSTRNTFNQVKMFYGMYKSFELMTMHEQKNNIKYDYVIRIRPDLFIPREVSTGLFNSIGPSDFAVVTGDYGVGDVLFFAQREVYERVVNLWLSMLDVGRLSPFDNYPKYDSHTLLLAWLVHKNIYPVQHDIQSSLTMAMKGLKVPYLKQALSQDCNIKMRFKYPEETKWLEYFLQDKAK